MQRTRTSGGFTSVMRNWTSIDRFTCLLGTYQNPGFPTPVNAVGTLRTMTDHVTPKFKTKSRRGEVIITPMTSEVESQTCSGTFSQVTSVANSCGAPVRKNVEDLDGPWGYVLASFGQDRLTPFSLISASDIASAVDVATTKAWENSAGHDASVLTDMAEMHQTLNMFRKPLSALGPLIRSISAAKHGKSNVGKVAKELVPTAQNLWLQYRYGVRPLVSSVNGVLKALKSVRQKSRRTERGYYSLSQRTTLTGSTSTWSTQFSWQDTQTDDIFIRTGILLEESLTIQQSLGIDAGGMLAVPWEIVPFSFVADWFINVGSWIGSLAPYLSKYPLGTWYTVQRNRTRVWKITSSSAVNPALYTLTRPPQEIRSAVWVTKQRVPGLKGPSLAFKPQALQKVLGDLRGLDSLALGMQQLGRLLKS